MLPDPIDSFINKHTHTRHYQPIVLVPGVVELKGKWHDATKECSDIILSEIEGKSILDVGCNVGYFLHEAKCRGATRAVGIDHDPIVIETALEVEAILQNGVEIIQMDAEEYIPPCHFDMILLMNILHVIKNPRALIERFLSKTSLLVIEHEFYHLEHFGDLYPYSIESPRCAGQRYLTLIPSNKTQTRVDHR